MSVDGSDQAVADEPFSWKQIPATQPENWIVGKTFTYFVGSHNGYARLADPVLQRRHVLEIAGSLWLIRDKATACGVVAGLRRVTQESTQTEHDLEIRWHVAPDLDVQRTGAARVEISEGGVRSTESRLSLITPEKTVWHTEVGKTLLSPSYGAFQPAPMVRCHARLSLPAETATALVPHCGAIRQEDEPRLASMAQAAVQVYELDDNQNNERHGFFFALGEQAWSSGPWSSDARVLYCRAEKEKLAHLVVIGGTYAAWQGQPLLKAAAPSGFFEWRRRDAEIVMNGAPSEFSVTPWFEELTSERSSPYAEKH
jgi:hypothetical protein